MLIFSDKEGYGELARNTAFKIYLTALSIIFVMFFFFDLFVDLITPLWLSAIIPFFFLIPLFLLRRGVETKYLITGNIIGLLSIFQFMLVLNPKHYYVLIYWIGLIPLLVVSIVKPKAAKIWGIVFLLFMSLNGVYVLINFPAYDITLFPKKFLTAGFIFWLITFSIVFIINYIQEKNKEILAERNHELSELKEEIENKNEELNTQNEEISKINDELTQLNENLEVRIKERTRDLEKRNEQLTEYAFINAHLLRAPVARVIGLLNLLDKTKIKAKRMEIAEHMKKAGKDLEEVVSHITETLEDSYEENRPD